MPCNALENLPVASDACHMTVKSRVAPLEGLKPSQTRHQDARDMSDLYSPQSSPPPINRVQSYLRGNSSGATDFEGVSIGSPILALDYARERAVSLDMQHAASIEIPDAAARGMPYVITTRDAGMVVFHDVKHRDQRGT